MSVPASPPARSRIAWIDLLRGFAVIGMVETHVVNTFLITSYDHVWWRSHLDFFNGLMAPAFLWIAGYMQGASARRNLERGRPVFTWSRLRRIGMVALLGCFMGAPWHLWSAGDFGYEGWVHFWKINILPCMALSLAILLVAARVGGKKHEILVVVLMLAAVLGAPLVAHAETGLLPVDAFLNRQNGSLFPLFPWLGFAATGYLASRWTIQWKSWLPVALGLIALAAVLQPAVFSNAHPAFFIQRLGWLGVLVLAVWAASQKVAPRWIQLAGRESLFLYIIHLLFIHVTPAGGMTLDRWLGHTQSPVQTALIFAAILGVSLLLAWVNDWRKQLRDASATKPSQTPGPSVNEH